MDIIDFLKNNIFIVFILFAILSGLMSKAKPGKQGNTRSMPPFGGGSTSPPSASDGSLEPERPRTEAPEYNRRAEGRTVWMEEAYDGLSGHEDERNDDISGYERTSYDKKAAASSRKASFSLDRETMTDRQAEIDVNRRAEELQRQVVQGIIWSEILGPPRSKRPFRK
ncbi:hypothetical protein [Paenibacillus sp. J2TS4]|uniref:hypothetical protein n=1 Tax=Paenibacillus sp. J2TS4 TaxID=2807194 RepID=UPI001B0C50D0|nr:hypothetical protein [Paenibacillus sp. J2TS4]GIP35834.1 hypothetical protein J2TS4_50440 [Paenibacillus sp. J2TS4]